MPLPYRCRRRIELVCLTFWFNQLKNKDKKGAFDTFFINYHRVPGHTGTVYTDHAAVLPSFFSPRVLRSNTQTLWVTQLYVGIVLVSQLFGIGKIGPRVPGDGRTATTTTA